MEKVEIWISVKDQLPKKPGWYKVKNPSGVGEVPFVRTAGGGMEWLTLGAQSRITHWMPKEQIK